MTPFDTFIQDSAERFDEKYDGYSNSGSSLSKKDYLKAFLRIEQYALISKVRELAEGMKKEEGVACPTCSGTGAEGACSDCGGYGAVRSQAAAIYNQALSDLLLALPEKQKEV